MASTRVTEDQFEVCENKVRHKPTGATFWAYPDSADLTGYNWGCCGEVLENGDDFDQDDVLTMAKRLLSRRLEKK